MTLMKALLSISDNALLVKLMANITMMKKVTMMMLMTTMMKKVAMMLLMTTMTLMKYRWEIILVHYLLDWRQKTSAGFIACCRTVLDRRD